MAEEINIKESNKALYLSLVVLALFVVALLTNGFGLLSGKAITGNTTADITPLAIGNSPVLGNPDAPVTIYEFSDFSCPFCAAASGYNQEIQQSLKARIPGWEAPIPEIKKEYIDSGKVKIVFKYFPGHGGAKAAHQVALGLNEQGLFWKFHDKVFESQQNLNNMDKMKDIAKELGADMQKLNNYINSGKALAQLDEDTAMGQSQNIKGTPAFVINGRLIEGAESFSTFRKIIEPELN